MQLYLPSPRSDPFIPRKNQLSATSTGLRDHEGLSVAGLETKSRSLFL